MKGDPSCLAWECQIRPPGGKVYFLLSVVISAWEILLGDILNSKEAACMGMGGSFSAAPMFTLKRKCLLCRQMFSAWK